MERLMLEQFIKEENIQIHSPQAILDLIECCSRENLDVALQDPSTQEAVKKYLVWLDIFLTNLETTHPGATELLKKGAIAVARSLIPGSLSAVDKTMEETFMKFSKSAGGLSGLFHNFGAYQRWCRTMSVRTQFFEKTLEMCDMIDDPEYPKNGKHRDLAAAQIKKIWSSKEASPSLKKCETAIICVEGKAYHLINSEDEQIQLKELHSLRSNQEETDTRVVLYLHHAAALGFTSAVVRTPDSDIFFILLHHSHSISLTIFLDIGTGKQRKLVNITELATELGSDYCSTLLGYYVFSGEDCTSAFKGKGKVAPLKKLQQNPKFQAAFRQLGEDWTFPVKVLQELEHFTCLMYGHARETSVNVVRVKMLQQMVGDDEKLTIKSKVDLSRIPPCQDSLIPHIQRVNHRVACYKRAYDAIIEKPKPYDDQQGWQKTEDGVLQPVWSLGPVLPPSMADVLETGWSSDSEDEDTVDYVDMLEYLDD
ncbi:uncharacterized protein LOC134441069 [Engraulis encrasicolus]|uniref:uncharacterized protein LOC134441069 n=1 Tax=Engraulis encrasicolus TaxID=184585 RepID=UPI002FD26BC6